jgi:hypothetical protein
VIYNVIGLQPSTIAEYFARVTFNIGLKKSFTGAREMNKKVPQVLARSIFLLLSFAASSAMAEGESVAKNSTIKEIKTSTDGFHWLTKNCNVEEGDEIETTPGSPPLTIDDPATPGCNNWEINLVLDGDISKDEKNFDLPVLDLNYGIGDNLQVKFEIPNVVLNSQNPRTQAI